MVFILVVLGVIIAAVVLGLVFIPAMIDDEALIGLAQEQVRAATGGELTVEGDTHLSLLPDLQLSLDTAALDLPPQGPGGERLLANIGSIDIDLSLIAALLGSDEIGDVKLNETEVQFFDSDGEVTNAMRLPRLIVSNLNIADQPMGLDAQLEIANLSGGEPIVITLDGAVRVPDDVNSITLDALKTNITGALTEAIDTTLSGKVILNPMKADLDLLAQLPGGDIDGDLIYTVGASPEIDLSFTTERLDLDKLQPMPSPESQDGDAASKAQTPAEEPPPTQATPPVPLPVGPLRDLDLRLDVRAAALLAGGQEITNAELLFRVAGGVADLEYLRGVLHEGQLDTTMQFDARKDIAEVELEGGLKGVELNSLLTSVASADLAQGRVDMAWDIDTQGATPDALTQGLDGNYTMNGSNVELLAVSVQDAMCQAIAQVNQTQLSEPMPATSEITTLEAEVLFGDGQARLSKLSASTDGVRFSGGGRASLSSLQFQADVYAQVFEGLEEYDPACKVDERISDLKLPVSCSGVLTGEPADWCGLNLDAILKQLLEGEVKGKIEKEAGKLLNRLFGN